MNRFYDLKSNSQVREASQGDQSQIGEELLSGVEQSPWP